MAKISFWLKSLKASLEFHVNHLLSLQIWQPKHKNYISKNPCVRYLLIRVMFLFINFHELQTMPFSRTFIFVNQVKILISRTSVFPNQAKTFTWSAYNIVKMAKRETCVDFCNVERYNNLTCQFSTSAFKNIWDSNIKMSSCVTKQRFTMSCFLPSKKWLSLSSKIKLWVKSHHHYNYKYP